MVSHILETFNCPVDAIIVGVHDEAKSSAYTIVCCDCPTRNDWTKPIVVRIWQKSLAQSPTLHHNRQLKKARRVLNTDFVEPKLIHSGLQILQVEIESVLLLVQ